MMQSEAIQERMIVMTPRWFMGYSLVLLLLGALAGGGGMGLVAMAAAGRMREVVLISGILATTLIVSCVASRMVLPGYRWWLRRQRRQR